MFKRKQQPAHECEITYDDVVEYLRDLEQADYTKILKVVSTYRDADKKVKRILNIKDEPQDDSLDMELEDISDLLLEDDEPKKVVIDKEPKGKKQ